LDLDVFFDELTISHVESPIIQEDHYYPFGLTMRGVGKKGNNSFKYNGKEEQDELGLGWIDYGARMYDAALGRFPTIDPLTDVRPDWSPYRYGYSNPIRYSDPTGMIEFDQNGNATYETEEEIALFLAGHNLRYGNNESQSNKKTGDSDNDEQDVSIEFGAGADASVVSDFTKDVLKDLGSQSGNDRIHITSTSRNAESQARVMFDNLGRDLEEQRRTYKAPGQRVIDVYIALKVKGLSDSEIIDAMTKAINQEGPTKVSRHAVDPAILNVVDISIRRLANPARFKTAAASNPLVRLLDENKVFHLEIQQLKPTDK